MTKKQTLPKNLLDYALSLKGKAKTNFIEQMEKTYNIPLELTEKPKKEKSICIITFEIDGKQIDMLSYDGKIGIKGYSVNRFKEVCDLLNIDYSNCDLLK